MVRHHWSSIPFLQWWRWNTATPTENSASSPSCLWAPSTTAAPLRAATTASCGAPPRTTSTKTANMASVPTNVSPSEAFPTKLKLKSKKSGFGLFSKAALMILDEEKVGWALCQEFFFPLDWIMERVFSKSLLHFTTVGFANHFVYLCYVAVHGTNMIWCYSLQRAKVHMYSCFIAWEH